MGNNFISYLVVGSLSTRERLFLLISTQLAWIALACPSGGALLPHGLGRLISTADLADPLTHPAAGVHHHRQPAHRQRGGHGVNPEGK